MAHLDASLNWVIIGLGSGFLPVLRQVITNDDLLTSRPLQTILVQF